MVKFAVAVVLIAVLSPIVIGITPGEMISARSVKCMIFIYCYIPFIRGKV